MADNFASLDRGGYKEFPETECRFHRTARKAYSYEAARDADRRWFEESLAEEVAEGSFVFYFRDTPHDDLVCKAMLVRLNLPELRPVIRVVQPAV